MNRLAAGLGLMPCPAGGVPARSYESARGCIPGRPAEAPRRSAQSFHVAGAVETGISRISAGVQAADLGGDGRDVDRPGRVHGDQRADADRPVGFSIADSGSVPWWTSCLGRALYRACATSAGHAQCTSTVRPPRPRRPAAGPALPRCRGGSWPRSPCRPRRPGASTAPHTRGAQPPGPGQVNFVLAGDVEGVVQRLLDQVLSHQRVTELRCQREGEAAFPRPRPPGDIHNPAHASHSGTGLARLPRDGPLGPGDHPE